MQNYDHEFGGSFLANAVYRASGERRAAVHPCQSSADRYELASCSRICIAVGRYGQEHRAERDVADCHVQHKMQERSRRQGKEFFGVHNFSGSSPPFPSLPLPSP